MKQLNAAVIGCGALARQTHLPHLNELDGVTLKWACDLNDEALQHAMNVCGAERTTRDFMEVIEDPEVDAIVLATHQTVRLSVIRPAAERGKHIYVEKPMADSLEEIGEIRRIVDETGIVFCVGHNRRSAPSIKFARDLFVRQRRNPAPCAWRFDRNTDMRDRWPVEDQGYMLIRVNDDILSWKPWAVHEGADGFGPMLFEMTHFTDLAAWFMDSAPVRVTTAGHKRANQTVTIEFEDGSLATIAMCGMGTFGYPKELYEAYAYGGAVILDHFVEVRTAGMDGVPTRTDFPLGRDPYPEVNDGGGIRDLYAKQRAAEQAALADGPNTLLKHQPRVNKGHKAHLAAFLDAARREGTSPATCADAVLATRIAFAALLSQKENRPVAMDEV